MNIEVSNRPSGPVGYQPVEFLDIPPMHETLGIASEPTRTPAQASPRSNPARDPQ